MSRIGVFTVFRSIVTSVVDNLGNPRPIFIGVMRDADVDSESVKAIETLVRYMLNTNFLTEESKLYLKSDEKISMIVEKMYPKASKNDIEALIKRFNNRVYYDQTKFKRIVSIEELENIAFKGASPKSMLERLSYELSMLGISSKDREKLMIDIPNNVMYSECSDEDFKDILTTLYPYTLGMKDVILEKLGKHKIGYFNYLMLGLNLSEKDCKNRDILTQMLNDEILIDDAGNVIED